MTKIAIISQPEQGVLVDIGGCDNLHEAAQHLESTFDVTNQFWEDQHVDLNLGKLRLSGEEVAQVLAILKDRGVTTRAFFSDEESTREALKEHKVEVLPPPPASATDGDVAAEGLGSWAEAAEAAAAKARAEAAVQSGTADGADNKVEAEAKTEGNEQQQTEEKTEAKVEAKAETKPAQPHVLFLRQTLRSGQSVSHKGHLVIIGDVNPGAEVSAEGDITIWGALRGIAHAGTAGNTTCEIRALKFDPIQLRIANSIARAPDRPRHSLKSAGPETARIVNGTIRISSSAPE
jgi:septum site-determining protein MinC